MITEFVHKQCMAAMETTVDVRLQLIEKKKRKDPNIPRFGSQGPALGEQEDNWNTAPVGGGGKGYTSDLFKHDITDQCAIVRCDHGNTADWELESDNEKYTFCDYHAKLLFSTELDPEEGWEMHKKDESVIPRSPKESSRLQSHAISEERQNTARLRLSRGNPELIRSFQEENKDFKVGIESPAGIVGQGSGPDRTSKKPKVSTSLPAGEQEYTSNEDVGYKRSEYPINQDTEQDLSERNTQADVQHKVEENHDPQDDDDIARVEPATALREAHYSKDMDSGSGYGSEGLQAQPNIGRKYSRMDPRNASHSVTDGSTYPHQNQSEEDE